MAFIGCAELRVVPQRRYTYRYAVSGMHPVMFNGILVGVAMIGASATMVAAYEKFSSIEYADVVDVRAAVATVSTPHEICTRSQNGTEAAASYCYTVVENFQEPAGYDVSYRLGAKRGTVRMDHDPGERIKVDHGELITDQTRIADNR
jgi:uncharacterized protein YcfJ